MPEGRYWDDFELSEVFLTPGREITEDDVRRFASLSGDLNPVHVDADHARQIGLDGLVPQTNLLIAMASGLIYRLGLFEGTGLALRHMTWTVLQPVQIGDTVRCRMTIVGLEPINEEVGVVKRSVDILSSGGGVVHTGTHEVLVRRRPTEPSGR